MVNGIEMISNQYTPPVFDWPDISVDNARPEPKIEEITEIAKSSLEGKKEKDLEWML